MTRPGIALAHAFVLVTALALGAGCASQSSSTGQPDKPKDTGSKVLKGVVVERDREAPGEGGSSFQGTGNYYLVFEVREGDATARYRFQVTYQQWFRYPEGSAVRITLRNNFLQDLRPAS
jgi:hypothetical protein